MKNIQPSNGYPVDIVVYSGIHKKTCGDNGKLKSVDTEHKSFWHFLEDLVSAGACLVAAGCYLGGWSVCLANGGINSPRGSQRADWLMIVYT